MFDPLRLIVCVTHGTVLLNGRICPCVCCYHAEPPCAGHYDIKLLGYYASGSIGEGPGLFVQRWKSITKILQEAPIHVALRPNSKTRRI